MYRNEERCVWDRDARFQSELRDAVLCIYGGVGRETDRLAKSLRLLVWVLARGSLANRENFYGVLGTGDPEVALRDRVFSKELSFFATGFSSPFNAVDMPDKGNYRLA